MDIDSRVNLIKQVGEEIITEEELRQLLETKKNVIAYDGFEPSGRIHIAQGLLRTININKMTKAGCNFKMWIADWFAWMNNKLGGDLEKIKITGNYFLEVWKASGMDLDKVEFLWASDVMSDKEYWKLVLQIAKLNSVDRIIRCAQIMGRKETETLSAAQILYPCMQCADIFYLKADITQLGMDQRKVNVLARETGPRLGLWKPVVVSHHMLMGLQQKSFDDKLENGKMSSVDRTIAMKMSKSNPDSAIFMTDSREDILRKINNAYCLPKEVNENPVLDYAKYIVFEKFKSVKVERLAKFGGNLEFQSYGELAQAYANGSLHAVDLKNAVAEHVDKLKTLRQEN